MRDYWQHDDIAALQLRYLEDTAAGPFLRCNAAHKRVVIVADPAAAAEILSRCGRARALQGAQRAGGGGWAAAQGPGLEGAAAGGRSGVAAPQAAAAAAMRGRSGPKRALRLLRRQT
jgi:hypothetical protein